MPESKKRRLEKVTAEETHWKSLEVLSSLASTHVQKKYGGFAETLNAFRAEGVSSSVADTVMTLMTFLKLGRLNQARKEDIAACVLDPLQTAYLYEAHLVETARKERLILLRLWNAVKEHRHQNPTYDMVKAQVHLVTFISADV